MPRVATAEPLVALTFDDGPAGATVDELIAILAAHDVRSTFFVVGGEIEAHPDAARRLVSAGHELGNHSYSHRRMVFKAPGFARAELERTDALIRAAGWAGPILFRPPYGQKLVGLPWYLRSTGRTSVTWDVEPESFPDVASSTPAIVAHVVDRVQPGSIVLLHPWYPSGHATRASIPQIIQRLRARGFRFVTVAELLQLAGPHAASGRGSASSAHRDPRHRTCGRIGHIACSARTSSSSSS